MTVSRRTVAVLLRRLTAAMRREGKKNVKGFNTRCQPALVRSRAARSMWSVPHPVQRAGASGRTVTAAHRMRSRRATSAHQRHGARGRTSSAARHVSGCRWAPVRRVWFTAPHTGRCTKPLPRQPPSAPGLCRRAASRTLPSSAMSGRDARRGPPGRCLRTALPRRAEGTGQKRTEHGPLEGALAARGETGAGVSRETHVLHHESAEERPETE